MSIEKHYLKALVLSLVLVPQFIGCTVSKKGVQSIQMDTITVSARNNPLDLYRAATPTIWDITHINAELLFNYENKTANGYATIFIRSTKNLSGEELNLYLDAKALQVSSVVGYKGSKKADINFKKVGDSLLLPMDAFALENYKSYTFNPQEVKPQKTIPYNDTIMLEIRYVSKPYTQPPGGSNAIREARGLYFINTNKNNPEKPAQIWTQGETEANSNWLPMIDKPNERFTCQLSLTVPDSMTTLSNGTLVSSNRIGVQRTDVWRTDYPLAAYLLTIVVGKYAKYEDRKAFNKPIDYYVEPQFASYAKGIFNHTPEMIEFFSKATGVIYPWNKYAQITVRDFVAGAMENTSASTFGDFVQKNNRELEDDNNDDIVAHELFHQWFGDYVTAESWSNITLNESFATYGEYLWQSYKYGTDYADEENREAVNAYVNGAMQRDAPLARYHYRSKEDVFDRISYQKGGAILRHLQDLIGDEAMSRAMQIYLSRNAHQSAEVAQWRMAVEEACGKDMNWFFKQWYNRQGFPELKVTYRIDNASQRLWVYTTQKSDSGLFTLPLTAALAYGKDLQEIKWLINKKQDSLSFPIKEGIVPVFIPDYKGTLVGKLVDQKNAPQAHAQYKFAQRALKRMDALRMAVTLDNPKGTDDSLVLQTVTYALDDSFPSIRSYALSLLETKYNNPKHQSRWMRQVVAMAENDVRNSVRADAIKVLAAWKAHQHLPMIKEWVQDSSYTVSGEALSAWFQLDSASAVGVARQVLKQKPKGKLNSVAWDIIGRVAAKEDLSFYSNNLEAYYFKEQNSMYWSLIYYAFRVKEAPVYQNALTLLQNMTRQTTFSRTRQNLVNGIRVSLYNKLFPLKDDVREKYKYDALLGMLKKLRIEESNDNIVKLYDEMIAEKLPRD